MTFTADIVWGCAVAVDRINGGYFKEPVYDEDEDTPVIKTHPNKLLMRRWLAANTFDRVTDNDIEAGIELRHYFNGYLLKELSGKINDFERQALRLAQQNDFTSRDLLAFSIISCLPSSQRRDNENKALRQEIYHSTPLPGDISDYVTGDLIIVKSLFNFNYSKYKIVGRFGESFVDFWYKEGFTVGDTVKIKGRIKRHREDGSAQLHYVKKVS